MVLEAHFINPMDSKKVKRMKVFKKIKPVISLDSRITQLQLAYFGHTIRRHQSLEKGIMLGPNRGNNETRRTSNPMARYNHFNDNKTLAELNQLAQDRPSYRSLSNNPHTKRSWPKCGLKQALLAFCGM